MPWHPTQISRLLKYTPVTCVCGNVVYVPPGWLLTGCNPHYITRVHSGS